jgi:hypothetical protein
MSHSLPPTIQRRAGRVALVWLVLMAVVDVLLLILVGSGRHALPYLLPFALAQVICLSFWIVFAPFGGLARWLQSLVGAVALFASSLLGDAVVSGNSVSMRNALSAGLEIPLFLLIVSLPLWLLRVVGGFRLSAAKQPREPETASSRQFSIADLLAVMFVVAASLGLARAAVSIDTESFAVVDESRVTWELWNIMSGASLTSIWIVLIAIPCAWTALVAKRRLRATVLLAVYTPIFACGLWLTERWYWLNPYFDPSFPYGRAIPLAIVFLSLWALRLSGVVLRRRPWRRLAVIDKVDEPVV